MTDSSDKLIKSQIKGRNVTYYLTTEEDLQNVRSNSLLGDVFCTLGALTAGGIISVILTRATGIQVSPQTDNVLGILLWVFIVATVVFAAFAFYFHSRSFAIISKIKGSGTVKSLKSSPQEEVVQPPMATDSTPAEEARLQILKAEYWTSKARMDVTERLRKGIVGSRLDTIASNDINGDPDVGTPKKLTIEYSFDGMTVTKEFSEGERIVIP